MAATSAHKHTTHTRMKLLWNSRKKLTKAKVAFFVKQRINAGAGTGQKQAGQGQWHGLADPLSWARFLHVPWGIIRPTAIPKFQLTGPANVALKMATAADNFSHRFFVSVSSLSRRATPLFSRRCCYRLAVVVLVVAVCCCLLSVVCCCHCCLCSGCLYSSLSRQGAVVTLTLTTLLLSLSLPLLLNFVTTRPRTYLNLLSGSLSSPFHSSLETSLLLSTQDSEK